LFNLTNNTSYNIQVSAYDDNGNESTLSRIVAMSTTNTRDVVPPSQPQNIRYSNISDTVINLEWDASTDNIAVVGYDIYIDGVNTYTVAGLSKEITLLTSRTDYLVKVQAVDSAGNVSIFSDTLNIQTL
jgi:chitodextrinase